MAKTHMCNNANGLRILGRYRRVEYSIAGQHVDNRVLRDR